MKRSVKMKNTKNIALFNPKSNLQLKGTYKLVVYDTYFEVCDENGNQVYYENSNKFWVKSEYDENNHRIYHENSKNGVILDNRPQPTTKVTLELTQSQLDKIKSML